MRCSKIEPPAVQKLNPNYNQYNYNQYNYNQSIFQTDR